jgi:hypothetical protein
MGTVFPFGRGPKKPPKPPDPPHKTAHNKLDEILAILRRIELKEDQLMSFSNDAIALLSTLDAATTAVAGRLTALQTQITDLLAQLGDAVSPEDKAEILASLQSEIDRLTIMAADPNNPAPEPV